MNIAVILSATLSLIAFFVHAFVGDKELCGLRPNAAAPDKISDTWVQARAGWHWVSIDLLFSAVVLFILGFTDIIRAKKTRYFY